MDHAKSADPVRRYYNDLGSRDWDRLGNDVAGRVSLEVHRRFLRRFITPGSRVLEVGAGPGRFTIELAALGCRIVVTDLSAIRCWAAMRSVSVRSGWPSSPRRETVTVRHLLVGSWSAV